MVRTKDTVVKILVDISDSGILIIFSEGIKVNRSVSVSSGIKVLGILIVPNLCLAWGI